MFCWETNTSISIGKEQTVDAEKTHLSLCVCVCNICNKWRLYKRYKLQNGKKLLQIRLSDQETSSTTLWCVLSIQFLDCTVSWVYTCCAEYVLCTLFLWVDQSSLLWIYLYIYNFCLLKSIVEILSDIMLCTVSTSFFEHFFFISPIWQPNIVSFTELLIFSWGDEVEWVGVLLWLCTNWNGCVLYGWLIFLCLPFLNFK